MTVSPPSLLVLFICSLVIEDPLPYLYVQSPMFCPGIEKVSIPMIYLDFTLSCIILLGECVIQILLGGVLLCQFMP